MNKFLVIPFSLLLFENSQVFCLEKDLDIAISNTHSNNVLLSESNKQDELYTSIESHITLNDSTQYLDFNIDYSLENTTYKNNLQEDNTVATGTAYLELFIRPRLLSWEASAISEELRRSRQDANISNNREQRNIFSTGPNWHYSITSVDEFTLNSRYLKSKYSDTSASNQERISHSANITHRLSTHQSVRFSYSISKSEFDNNLSDSISKETTYISFNSKNSTLDWFLKLGYNRSEQKPQLELNSPFYQADISYSKNGHQASLSLINLITDSTLGIGDILVEDSSNQFSGMDSNFTEIDIVKRNIAQLSYTNLNICNLCEFSSTLEFDEQNFQTQNNDEDSLSASLNFSYGLSRFTSSGIHWSQQEINFNTRDRKDTITIYGLSIDHDLSRNSNLNFRLQNEERKSDEITSNYKELRATLNFTIRFF